jgi:hypothetical protein
MLKSSSFRKLSGSLSHLSSGTPKPKRIKWIFGCHPLSRDAARSGSQNGKLLQAAGANLSKEALVHWRDARISAGIRFKLFHDGASEPAALCRVWEEAAAAAAAAQMQYEGQQCTVYCAGGGAVGQGAE